MKFLTILLLILFSSNLTQAQIKNRVYGEVHLLRIGPDIRGGYLSYYDQVALDFLHGFELGYAISENWISNLRVRRDPLFTLGEDFSEFHAHRIEFSLGIEYIRKYRKKGHWSYGVGYFFESVKSRVGNCRSRDNISFLKNKRYIRGVTLQLGYTYRIKPDLWLIISSRYRTGTTWLPKHSEVSPFEYYCFDRNAGIDNFEVISKLGFRFFL